MMPVNVSYSIAACSGEDAGYPSGELLLHSQDCRGWCTPRNCSYPQHLTLRLDRPAALHQIQLLSHEYKIAAKVEIQVASSAPSAAAFTRLGYLSFDSNERTPHSARELKSVTLGGTEAALVRFVIHRCHANALNAHHQVGLITLNIVGDPLSQLAAAPAAMTELAAGPAAAPPLSAAPQQQPLPESAAEVDSVTAQRIQELQALKAAAVAVEDYDEAKRLKAAVDKLRAAGGKIAALEARKAAAVSAEDYDTAKTLKTEVERLRHRAYAALLRGSADGAALAALPSPMGSSGSRPASSAAGDAAAHSTPFAGGMGASAAAGPGPAVTPLSAITGGSAAVGLASPPGAARSSSLEGGAAPGGSDWRSYDERPARAKGAYDLANIDAEAPPPGAAAARRNSGAASDDAGPAPPGFPADLPPPEALSAGDAKDAVPLSDLVGEFLSRCVYSRTWQLREAALLAIAADIARPAALPSLDTSGDGLRTLCRAVGRGLKDRVAAVGTAALSLLRALTSVPARRFPARDMHAAVGELVPALVERAADLNARSREQAVDMLVHLAGVKDTGLKAGAGQLLRPLKRSENPKATLGRLQAVAALLPVVGVALKAGGEGLSVEGLVDFVAPALMNSSAEVRGAGVELAVSLAEVAGPAAVLPLLPSGLNPKVREQVEAGLVGRQAGGGAPAGGASFPRHGEGQQVTWQGGEAAEGRRRSSHAAPAGAAPAARAASRPGSTAAAAGQQRQRGSSQHHSAAESRGGAATAAKRSSTMHKQLQRRSPSPAARPIPAHYPGPDASPASATSPLPELSIADEDPRPYEAELAQREAQLGPAHPAVAEAASNLAIIYNQRGDAGRALPLYQRALAIWEASHGPTSADVAHSLTDIAVIHLEAGREAEGRALLGRALAIQEALLGPNHPDVVAIRDVLEE